ncbi:MAG: hypothetical protein J6A01_00560 [Proteobacteria bacterium]|nr:hypothetical protein [Pseudomonadota bacterium]
MKTTKWFISMALIALICGCDSDDDSAKEDKTGQQDTVIISGQSINIVGSVTQTYSGNIESVRVVEGRELPSAIAVSSKTKVIRYLENDGKKLNSYYDDFNLTSFIHDDDEDNELTNSAVYDEKHTFVTHTLLTKNTSKEITACSGNIYMVTNEKDASGNSFSIKDLTVGPMPDAIAVTPDKKYAITANEYDSTDNWGKCPVGAGNPSVSIIDLSNIHSNDLKVSKQIQFTQNALKQSREPEYIAIASDSDTVAVTLQDSYEVALFKLSVMMKKDGEILDESDVKFIDIPANAAGIQSWPDGIIAFDIGSKHYFAMAGEGSDSIIIIDDTGAVVSNTQITEKEVPTNYPCLEADWFPGTKYSPDSVTSFSLNNKTYVAATLRYAGAVIVYDVTNPSKPNFELITRAGVGDVVGNGVCSEDTSKVYPEGISSGIFGNAAYIWVANEGDHSVTSIKVVAK